jgi:hypothetical protein
MHFAKRLSIGYQQISISSGRNFDPRDMDTKIDTIFESYGASA